jgi:phage gp37-like protein
MIITQIEGAMITRIKLVNTVPNFGNLLKTVDRYSGEFNAENMDLLVTMAPFVLLSHTRSQVLQSSATGSQWLGEFTLLCGSTSRRTQTLASRVGGVASIELGSRQIAELIRDILSAQQLGLPISALEPVAIDELYSGQAGGAGGQHFFSVTGLQFSTKYSTTRSTAADPAGAALAEIVATFAAQFDGGATIDDPANNTVSITLPETGVAP